MEQRIRKLEHAIELILKKLNIDIDNEEKPINKKPEPEKKEELKDREKCSNCLKEKDKNEFILNGKTYKTCNTCREKDREKKKKAYDKDPDKKKEKNAKYYEENKEKICEQKKVYYENREWKNNRCTKCNKDLPNSDFDTKDDGTLHTVCKICRSKYLVQNKN